MRKQTGARGNLTFTALAVIGTAIRVQSAGLRETKTRDAIDANEALVAITTAIGARRRGTARALRGVVMTGVVAGRRPPSESKAGAGCATKIRTVALLGRLDHAIAT